MKAKILSLLLVVALLVTATVFAAEAAVTLPDECSINYGSDELALTDGKAECPVCGSSQTWQPLPVAGGTGETVLATGHYYLDPTVEYTAEANTGLYGNTKATGGSKVCIHLNGQTWTGKGRFLYGSWASTFNIIGAGTIQTATANHSAGSLISLDTATINLYGGTYTYVSGGTHTQPAIVTGNANSKVNIYNGVTIQDVDITAWTNATSKTGPNGGAVYIPSGQVVMYGGTIQNCGANYGGASVYVTAKTTSTKASSDSKYYATGIIAGTFKMYGGTISGGHASTINAAGNGNGGNIRVKGLSQKLYTIKDGVATQNSTATVKHAKFEMYGGTISDGAAYGSGGGGNVCVDEYADMIMYDGTIKDGDVTGSGSGGNLLVRNRATFRMDDGTISGGNTQGRGHGGNILGQYGSTMTFNDGEIKDGDTDQGSGGNMAVEGTCTINGGTFTGGVSSTAAPGAATKLTTGGGNIRVADCGTMTMNGGIINGGVVDNGTTTQGKGGGAVCVTGTMVMNGGTIYGGTGGYGGGAVLVGGTIDAETNKVATFTMNGGTIDATTATGTTRGAAVFVEGTKGAEFIMGNPTPDDPTTYEAPTIIGGSATNGGAVCNFGGKFTMNCGTISGGHAIGTGSGTGGGNLYNTHKEVTVDDVTTVYYSDTHLKGGTIMDGTAAVYGGNIFNYGGTITMYEGFTISGGATPEGTASAYGGNVCNNGTFNMKGGTISDGKTYANSTASGGGSLGGGNVCHRDGTFTMDNGTITGGKNLATANTGHGGNVTVTGGTFILNDGTIENGVVTTATSKGANVYTYSSGKFTMNGGKVQNAYGGAATGANIYARGSSTTNSATITLNGGEVIGSAANKGGNIDLFYYGKVIVDGATVRDGYTTDRGGNIVVNNTTGGNIQILSGKVIDGTAEQYGGNIYIWGASTTNMAVLNISDGEVSGGTVLYDATDAASLQSDYDKRGGNIFVNGKGVEVTISGGKIFDGNAASGGNIFITADALDDGYPCTVTISGGEIYGGVVPTTGKYTSGAAAYGYGANVELVKGTLNIKGTAKIYQTTTGAAHAIHGGNLAVLGGTVTVSETAEIYGGIAKVGGNIHKSSGTLNLLGGTIRDGSARYCDTTTGAAEYVNGARNCGGNVYVSSGTNTLTGVTVSGGYAGSWGGNMYLGSGTTINDGTVIENPSYAYKGGNIYLNAGTITINGGTFTGTDAFTAGGGAGNIAVGGATVYLKGGLVDGGKATTGGAIRVDKGSFYLQGATVQNGLSTAGGGGNLYVAGGTEVKISSGKITGGHSDKGTTKQNSGGNIYIGASATVTMEGGIVANGNAAADNSHGGNVYVGGVFNLSGGHIYGGKCTGYGGNVALLESTSTLNMTGGTLDGSKVEGVAAEDGYRGGGNNLLVYAGTVNLTGGEIINGNDAGDYSVQLRKGGSMPSVTATLGGTAKVDQLSFYTADNTTLTIQADFTGTAYLHWHEDLKIPADATASFHSGITYGSVLGVPVVVEDGYNNGGSLWTKDMPIVYGDKDSDGTKELYIASYTKVVGQETFEGVLTDKQIGIASTSDVDVTKGEFLKLHDTSAPVTISKDMVVDVNGKTVTINTENDAVVSLLDTTNDDYNGFGKVTIAKESLASYDVSVNGKRYITVKNADGTYSAHRIELKVTSVNIRPSVAGIYYGATFMSDTTLANAATYYGIAASIVDMPGDLEENDVLYTEVAGPYTPDKDKSVYGVMIGEIMTEGGENDTNGKTPVYVNPYVIFRPEGQNDDTAEFTIFADEENKGQQAGIGYSLYSVLKIFDESEALYNQFATELEGFFAQPIFEGLDWGFTRIGASTAE